jgi:ribosomal protein S18 acetylase RimI-like enzyme
MHVRRATDRDLPQIVELNRVVQDLHVRNEPERYCPTDDNAVSNWLAEAAARPGHALWVVEEDAVLLGYALFIARDSAGSPFTYARRSFLVDQIAVAVAAQGRGVGRLLMETAQEQAGSLGVELTVRAHNSAAIGFYERLGYQVQQLQLLRRPVG